MSCPHLLSNAENRANRLGWVGVPHHPARQRAPNRLFFTEADYRLYLDLFRSNSQRAGLEVWGYCLMPNHVHLIAFPTRPQSMARALGRTHADYARHFNIERRSLGCNVGAPA